MIIASNDPHLTDPTPTHHPSRREIPELTADPLAFARGCLLATAVSAVFWLAALWLVAHGR